MINFEITRRDVMTAFLKTKYQRGPASYSTETQTIKNLILETPIPKTKYLHVTEAIQNQPKPEPKPKPKEAPKPQKQNTDIYSMIRQAQGLTGSEGPKKGNGAAVPFQGFGQRQFMGMNPRMYPRMGGIRPVNGLPINAGENGSLINEPEYNVMEEEEDNFDIR